MNQAAEEPEMSQSSPESEVGQMPEEFEENLSSI